MFSSIWDIVGIATIGIFAIIIIIIAAFLFKKMTIKGKGAEITLSRKDEENIDNSNKIILILKLLQKTEENAIIKSNIIPEQMKYLEQKVDLLREKILNIYLKFLEKYNLKESDKKDEYKIFIKIIKSVYREIKDNFRKSFIENGIIEKEDFDWEKWKKEKNETLISIFNKQLEIEYLSNLSIKRQDLINILKKEKYFEEMQEKFFEVSNEAKKISLNKNKEIKKNRAEMDECAFKIFGIDLNLDNEL
jgi:hypothetical protein